ncbi:MAG: DNA polymerase III subunit beta, partial [Pseudomonadota bacterium]
NRAAFAMANQDVRFYLIGMLFELSGHTFRVVATDGHRLAANAVVLDQEFPENTRVIVPRRTVTELERLLSGDAEKVHISLSDSTIRFSGTDWSFVSKLIDGRYPDYEKVIPQGAMRRICAERDILKGALQRVGALLEGRQFPVEWQVSKNNLKFVIKNEGEEAEDELDLEYEGGTLSVIYKFNYLLDMLNALDAGAIEIWMVESNQAMKIEQNHGAEKGIYVLMPMKA